LNFSKKLFAVQFLFLQKKENKDRLDFFVLSSCEQLVDFELAFNEFGDAPSWIN
jgi:hypothetical protein